MDTNAVREGGKSKNSQYIRINEEALIAKVKLHPHLYDMHAMDYKDSKKCTKTWEDIAEELDIPGEWKQCKERWRTLRDVYVRKRKGIMAGEKYKRPRWRFFDQMGFLTPYISHRPTETDVLSTINSNSPSTLSMDVESVLYESEPEAQESLQDHPTTIQDSSNETILVDGLPIKEEVEWIDEDTELTEKLSSGSPSPPPKSVVLDTPPSPPLPHRVPHLGEKPVLFRMNLPSGSVPAVIGDNKLLFNKIKLLLPTTVNKMPTQIKTTGSELQPQKGDGNSGNQLPPLQKGTVQQCGKETVTVATNTCECLCRTDAQSFNAGQEPRPYTVMTRTPTQDDEEELFGRYIAAAIRKLRDRSKSLAKLKIQQVLFHLEESD